MKVSPDIQEIFDILVSSIYSGNSTPLVKIDLDSVYIVGHCIGSYLTQTELNNTVFAIEKFTRTILEYQKRRIVLEQKEDKNT